MTWSETIKFADEMRKNPKLRKAVMEVLDRYD